MSEFLWPPGPAEHAIWEVEATLGRPRVWGEEPTVELRVWLLDDTLEGRELNDAERFAWLSEHGARAVQHALDLEIDRAVAAAERRAEGP